MNHFDTIQPIINKALDPNQAHGLTSEETATILNTKQAASDLIETKLINLKSLSKCFALALLDDGNIGLFEKLDAFNVACHISDQLEEMEGAFYALAETNQAMTVIQGGAQ
ncbi:MAG: hypothetical protein WCS28_11730 [Thiomicrospira sp.]|jgi:hypothetical protein